MAKKLWEKNIDVNPEIERFTVGRDRELDLLLARYDVLGSLAHSKMLESIGLLTSEEMQNLHAELRNIYGIMEELSEAQRHIEQNVNGKMVFFDMSLRMIVWIKNR